MLESEPRAMLYDALALRGAPGIPCIRKHSHINTLTEVVKEKTSISKEKSRLILDGSTI